jgi:excisionase family DNA binding protein
MLKPREVAEMLQLGRVMTYRLLKSGAIPSVRFGKAIRIPRAAVEELLRSALAPESGEARGEEQGR